MLIANKANKMPKQIKVLHFLHKMHHGGIETWLMNVLRNIDRDRFNFTICTSSEERGDYDEEIRSLGADMVSCSMRNGYRSFTNKFNKILHEGNFDVVHSHMLLFSGWVTRLAAKANVPTRIAHVHTTNDRYKDTLSRIIYRRIMRAMIVRYATHGIACSSMAADFGFPNKWRAQQKYNVMLCGINTDEFKTIPDTVSLKNTLGVPENARVIGHVGNFVPVKNHEFLIHTFNAINKKLQNVHFLLIGDGPLRPAIEDLSRKLGIAEKITFAGRRDDVPLIMTNLVDALIFPSILEGLGLVTVEAQCAGIPTILSDSLPSESTIINELVKRVDLSDGPELWATLAIELLEKPKYDKTLALQQIRDCPFDISTSIDHLCNIYKNNS